MKKGILFDLDGTLWDACDAIAASWNEYLERFALDIHIHLTEDDLRRACGLTMTAIGDLLFGSVEEKRRREITEGCCVYEVEYLKTHGGKLYPQVAAVLEALSKNYHLYIVSNCQTGYVENFLAWSGMDRWIEDYEYFERTGKPKADNIRILLDRQMLDWAVSVGDTQGDCSSAVSAGIPFIHATYGFGTVDGDFPKLERLEDLPDVLEEMQK